VRARAVGRARETEKQEREDERDRQDDERTSLHPFPFDFTTLTPHKRMESLLSDSSIQAELAAFKATADLLASQKLRLANSFVPPVEQRPKRATLVNVSNWVQFR
jgi:hypothetical protein